MSQGGYYEPLLLLELGILVSAQVSGPMVLVYPPSKILGWQLSFRCTKIQVKLKLHSAKKIIKIETRAQDGVIYLKNINVCNRAWIWHGQSTLVAGKCRGGWQPASLHSFPLPSSWTSPWSGPLLGRLLEEMKAGACCFTLPLIEILLHILWALFVTKNFTYLD